MNTQSDSWIPLIPKKGMRNFVYCLEDLELAIEKEDLKAMTRMWNRGASIEYLSKKFKKQQDEVFLMLFHQARKGKIKRPFAYQLKEKAHGQGT